MQAVWFVCVIAADSCSMTCEGITQPSGVRAVCTERRGRGINTLYVRGVSELAAPGGMYATLHAADTAHSLVISLIVGLTQKC